MKIFLEKFPQEKEYITKLKQSLCHSVWRQVLKIVQDNEIGKKIQDSAIISIENALLAANKKLDEKDVPRQLDEIKKGKHNEW